MTHAVAIDNGWTSSREVSLNAWLKAVRTALALDPSDSQAQVILGNYYQYVGDLEHSLAALEKAVSLNPNDADVLLIAWGMPWFGRPEQAAELADRAIRLNPNDPDWYIQGLLPVYFVTGQYDRALAVTQSRLNPDMWDFVYRPPVYVRLGRVTDAGVVLERSRRPVRLPRTPPAAALPVPMLTVVLDDPPAIAKDPAGLVVAAAGGGSTPPAYLELARTLIARSVPVMLTTRCPSGEVLPGYAFPGIADERVAKGVAGFIGTLGVFALGFGAAAVLRRRATRDRETSWPASATTPSS